MNYDLDNKELMKLLMMNNDRRETVTKMAAQVIAAAVVYSRSEDEILAITNILIKAEIEKHRPEHQKIMELNKMMERLFDDFNNSK